MRFSNPPRYQWIGFWLSMPFISLALAGIMFGERMWHDPWLGLKSFSLIYFIGYFSFRGHHIYDHFITARYPSLRDTRKRVWLKIPVNVLVMTPSVVLILFLFQLLGIGGYTVGPDDLKYGYLVGLGVNIVFQTLWEVIYIIDKFKESAADQERIRQLQLRQEFDNLKEKVNPHFLFNSFNTLSSLITEDPDQAEKFLDELSKVYRYLLRNNESGLSTVAQETAFIESYARLLSTRFGEGFRLVTDIRQDHMDRSIPSLCLQLLVENAVKHNVVSRQQPVTVTIRSTPSGHLLIENNLNRKARPLGESTGIGLSNIREKYKLLQRTDVTVETVDDKFRVTIPLL